MQLLFALFEPKGHWQMPHIARVTVTRISRDQEGKITGQVIATEGEQEREMLLSPKECLELSAGEDAWILDHYWADGIRPNQFLLTPTRLLTEYPEPLLILAAWAIWRLRRKQKAEAKAILEAPNPNRKVWKDDFHSRAERFSQPGKPEEK
ncbi:MAG TPA: hypothetical protein VJ600_03470 [Holophagaceae bacterium]|nr:hypothetical protein [Holophagaceae bacterium]